MFNEVHIAFVMVLWLYEILKCIVSLQHYSAYQLVMEHPGKGLN